MRRIVFAMSAIATMCAVSMPGGQKQGAAKSHDQLR
jgi:hypothetical protein